jgi:hypothetical protein
MSELQALPEAAHDKYLVTAETMQECFKELGEETLDKFVQFASVNNLAQPIQCHVAAAATLNATMMALLTHVNALGGILPGAKSAALLLAKLASEQVLHAVPPEWDTLCGLAASAVEHTLVHTVGIPQLQTIIAHGMSADKLATYRIMLFCHIVKTLGVTQFMRPQGPVTTADPYVRMLKLRGTCTKLEIGMSSFVYVTAIVATCEGMHRATHVQVLYILNSKENTSKPHVT